MNHECDYPDILQQAFEQAYAGTAGNSTSYLKLAGKIIRLKLIGPRLRDVYLPAFSHLLTEEVPDLARVELTIGVWDNGAGSVAAPLPEWAAQGWKAGGQQWRYRSDRFKLLIQDEAREGLRSLNLLDAKQRFGVYWIEDSALLPPWEAAAPLRTLLHWWTSWAGLQIVHAAAVGTSRGAVLLIGKGGSGKSSTALSCVGGGMLYVADDYAAVEGWGSRVWVHSLYSSAKLHAVDVRRLAPLINLLPHLQHRDRDKELLFLSAARPKQIVAGLPLIAIVHPEVKGTAETELVQMPAAAAVRELVSNTMSQFAWASQSDLTNMLRLLARVPSFRLCLGSDIARIPDVIGKLIESACLSN